MATETLLAPTEGVRPRRSRGVKSRPTVLELASSAPCDLSIPIVFLIMARHYSSSVKAYPHRRDPTKWCFRFGVGSIVEVSTDGEAEWITGNSGIRRDIDALIACARARHAQLNTGFAMPFADG